MTDFSLFVEHHMQPTMLDELTLAILREIGIRPVGHCLLILKFAKAQQTSADPPSPARSPAAPAPLQRHRRAPTR